MVGITRSKVIILLIPSAQFERCFLKNQDPANPSSNRRMAPILAALTLTGPTCIVLHCRGPQPASGPRMAGRLRLL